ncbi:MAG: OmpA family protein [Planctomycetota bacterium]
MRGRWLLVGLTWLVLLGLGAALYRFVLAPRSERQLLDETSSARRTDGGRELKLALDAFSGYCLFRSDALRTALELRGIGLECVDDGADYALRLRRLDSGELPVAVFTIDALIKACADLGKLPGTIVMLVDESRGADALLAHRSQVPDLDALNRTDARIVTVAGSPGETLSRVVRNTFNLSQLPMTGWSYLDTAAQVERQLTIDGAVKPYAYALWEPYVSNALAQPNVIRLADSSKFKGCIVDVLVVQREFLRDRADDVLELIEAYQRALFAVRQRPAGMTEVVLADARRQNLTLTAAQAEQLCRGLWWKNTSENYGHLGIRTGPEAGGLQPLETMISNLIRVLLATGAIARDPTDGQPNILYYDRLFSQLAAKNFHPAEAGAAATSEAIRVESELRALSEAEWEQLLPVGTLTVERIVFPRGAATLLPQSEAVLRQIAQTLADCPQYYLRVNGQVAAASAADPAVDAMNRELALRRAAAAVEYLRQTGVSAARMHATQTSSRANSEQYTVTFLLCQLPF